MIALMLTGLLRGVRTRRSLVLENLALRHQLAVLQRAAPRPRLRPSDRLFWVLTIRRAKPGPGRWSRVHGELLAQGEVLQGELAVAAAEEREESKQVE